MKRTPHFLQKNFRITYELSWPYLLAFGSVFAFLCAPSVVAQTVSGSVSLSAIIGTVAGNGTAGFSGDGGLGSNAELSTSLGVAVDGAGNLYIADSGNNRIRKVDVASGVISTVAGNGTAGFSGDGGLGSNAELSTSLGVAVDGAGNLYIADSGNNRIRKVDVASGVISTVAGNGTAGFSGDGGLGSNAELSTSLGVAVDGAGNLYIADSGNNRIRKVDVASGVISTVAGNGTAGFSGDGGLGSNAELSTSLGVAVDGAGNLYIADSGNNRIRKVDVASGVISTVAGNGTAGFSGDGGLGSNAELSTSLGVAVDGAGNLYIADSGNNRIRKVDVASGVISTVAGNGTAGFSGDGGLGSNAELSTSLGAAVDGAGNLYIADSGNSRIRKVGTNYRFPAVSVGSESSAQTILIKLESSTPVSSISATAEGSSADFLIGTISGCAVDGATNNSADTVCAVTLKFRPVYPGTRFGTIIVSNGNTTIGTIGLNGIGSGPELVESPGMLNVIAGGGNNSPTTAPSSSTNAQLSYPYGIAVDDIGNLYIADTWSNLVEKVDAKTGELKVVAGGGQTIPSSAPENATDAKLYAPTNLVVDGALNIYISDLGNDLVEKVDASTGKIVAIAGGGYSAPTTASQPATNVMLYWPYGLALDGNGNLFIADSGNYLVEKLTLTNDQLAIVAGGGNEFPGSAPIPATSAIFIPYGLAVDTHENVYIADYFSEMIEKVDLKSGELNAVAGGGSSIPGIAPISATDAYLSNPYNVAVDGAGDLYIADGDSNNLIEKVDAASGSIRAIAGGGSLASNNGGQPSTGTALQQPIDVALAGNGTLYVSEFGSSVIDQVGTSASLDFPDLLVGETSPFQFAWIDNIGNNNLTLSALNNPADYQIGDSGSCTVKAVVGQVLGSGDSCSLSYAFRPTAGGPLNEIATLTDNSLGYPNAQHEILLNGTSLSIATTLSVTASPSQATAGTSITLTATVQSSQGVPTGTVTFSSGGIVLGSAPLNASGMAALTTTVLPVGTDTVTASFASTANYAPSSGAVMVTIAVAPPVATTLSVTASPSQATAGNSITLTATVQSSQGVPTGTVTFSSGGIVLGSAPLNASGMAALTTTVLPLEPIRSRPALLPPPITLHPAERSWSPSQWPHPLRRLYP